MITKENNTKIFKEKANWKLRGITFDAKHLYRLINHESSNSKERTSTVNPLVPRENFKDKMKMRKTWYENMR